MAGPGSDGDLRRLLKLHRTEIAMAVDDVFPLLHGLADHDVVPDHIFKETLSRAEREGSHRAFHALLTWLLGRDTAALRDFWAVLFKDYNLERYSRLRPLRGAFPRGKVELGRQRRGRRLSPSPTAPAPHRPQGKRKAPEERDKARAAQAASACVPCLPTALGRGLPTPLNHPLPAALQAVAASVQRAVAVAGGEVPVSRGAIEGILIKHVLDPSKYSPAQPSHLLPSFVPKFRSHPQAGRGGEGELELPLASLADSSKMGSRAGDKPYTPTACEEPEARSRSHSLKPPAQPKACQSVQTPPSCFHPILCSCQSCGRGLFLHGIIAMAWGCPPVQAVPLKTPSRLANRTGNPNCTPRASCKQPLSTARTLSPTR
uniref:HSR domain-containing protein n=1 Tax=Junco hyemalis TaxID=40217 RepID=A0A8C5JMZ2_JUNHY